MNITSSGPGSVLYHEDPPRCPACGKPLSPFRWPSGELTYICRPTYDHLMDNMYRPVDSSSRVAVTPQGIRSVTVPLDPPEPKPPSVFVEALIRLGLWIGVGQRRAPSKDGEGKNRGGG